MLVTALIVLTAGCTPAPRYVSRAKVVAENGSRPVKGVRRSPVTAAEMGHPLLNLGPHRINSPFGMRIHPVHRTRFFHHGVDFKARAGEGVYAVADGTVKFSGRQRRYGRVVIIEHPGDISSVYAHLSETAVQQGERVARGHRIGRAGKSGNATGAHLHFEIRVSGSAVDPLEYIGLR